MGTGSAVSIEVFLRVWSTLFCSVSTTGPIFLLGFAKSRFNVSLWPKRSSSGLAHQRARLPLEATDPLVVLWVSALWRLAEFLKHTNQLEQTN